jgi:hypothetical protein
MTVEKGEDNAEFQQSVTDCVEDLNGLLPRLSQRYDMPVIIGAMAEHVGLALWALRHQKLCDLRQASLAIQHLEYAAFPPGAPAGSTANSAPE